MANHLGEDSNSKLSIDTGSDDYLSVLIEQRVNIIKGEIEMLVGLNNRNGFMNFLSEQYDDIAFSLDSDIDPESDLYKLATFGFNHLLRLLIDDDKLNGFLFSGKTGKMNDLRVDIINGCKSFIDEDVLKLLIENSTIEQPKKEKKIKKKLVDNELEQEKYYDDEDDDI